MLALLKGSHAVTFEPSITISTEIQICVERHENSGKHIAYCTFEKIIAATDSVAWRQKWQVMTYGKVQLRKNT